jgi:hypothetical protein
MSFKTATIIVALLSLAVPSSAAAKKDNVTWLDTRLIGDRGSIHLGGYLTDFKTEAAVGSGTILGTVIRLEEDLAVEKYNRTFRLGGFYRFKPRQGIRASYFSLSRSGSNVLDETISCCGYEWAVGAQLDTEFDVQVLALVYQYSIVNNGRTEAGFTAGLSTYDFNLVVEGEGTITPLPATTGVRESSGEIKADEGIIAPIPTVGIFIAHAITPNLIVAVRASFLDLTVGDYSGRLVDSSVTLEYFFNRTFGVGFGSNTTDIDVSNSGDDNPWLVNYRQAGLLAYLSFVF